MNVKRLALDALRTASIPRDWIRHWEVRGQLWQHVLAGGWCPICGSIFNYPGWSLPTEEDWQRCNPRLHDAPCRKLLPYSPNHMRPLR